MCTASLLNRLASPVRELLSLPVRDPDRTRWGDEMAVTRASALAEAITLFKGGAGGHNAACNFSSCV
jgi:hypothetical protein